MGLDGIFKLGYAMLAFWMVLIVYGSLSSASPAPSSMYSHLKNTEKVSYPPCFFNPLCTCSKAVPDLGIVMCRDIPLPRIPPPINNSKVFMLHLENNGLRHIEPHFLQGTGLYRIEISWNELTEVATEAFMGLERSLWELDLRHNKLTSVPSRSLRYLQKLKMLDLTGNEITDLSPENWRGLEESLESLILKDNGISMMPPGTFSLLQNLQHLDLSGNAILELDTGLFRDGPPRLSHLYLADNMFFSIPYQQLSHLRQLRYLDLALNRISQMDPSSADHERRQGGGGGGGGGGGATLSLDTLHLEYNQLQYLPPNAFQYIQAVNKTYFDGNPISIIQGDAFQGPRVRELYLRDCGLSELAPGAFNGLESSLHVLDLTGNNLTMLPQRLFNDFDFLRTLFLRDNFVQSINPGESLNGFQYSLYRLDMSGKQNGVVSLQDLRRLRNLRSLTVSRLSQPHISADDFQEFGVDLEELQVIEAGLKTIKNHAFKNVRGLKRLDLSENSIATIENEAFTEVGHSLTYLNLAYGLASSFNKLPAEAFKHLTSLHHLDMSNNKLKSLPESTFHFMKKLKIVKLEDNNIDSISKGTFQGDTHSSLEEIHMSFNHLSTIGMHAFVDLNELRELWLDDNKITKIEKRAFMNLDKLRYLDMRGNKISFLSEEAFQNLPQLEELDLAYNSLKDFDFTCLDQVGTMSSFSLNVSHNSMRQLNSNNSMAMAGMSRMHGMVHANVKILDFSHNNISNFGRWYFKPVESSLTHLHLAHNSLRNITKEVFGNFMHLQWFDVSWNDINELEFDSFKHTQGLQVIYMAHNHISDVPNDLFRSLSDLRVVDLSWNKLRTLPDILFTDEAMEKLDVSWNHLSRVPLSSFSGDAAESLVHLDVSNNAISALHSPDTFSRFKSLQWLDLSSNRLVRLEDGAFSYLSRLYALDLSHNLDIILDIKGRTFQGLEDTLEDLFLRNLSLNAVPELHLPSLNWLDLSENEISVIPQELSQNLSTLRHLELSGNLLGQVPSVINSLTQLRKLGLARNPIQTLNFPQGSRLRELDIRQLPLTFFEVGALGRMPELQTLRLSPCKEVREFNLPHLLQDNHGLEHLHVEVFEKESSTLGDEMKGPFPAKLRNITLSGKALKNLGNEIFQGLRNPRLNLVVRNTSLDKIPKSVFQQARFVRNVTVDVRYNNIKSLGNPSSGFQPNLPRKTFLLDLKMTENHWTCDCELGWIEGWERKKRQYLCDIHDEHCYRTHDDLRVARCENKKGTTVLEVLKSELECGWSAAPRFGLHFVLPTILTLLVVRNL